MGLHGRHCLQIVAAPAHSITVEQTQARNRITADGRLHPAARVGEPNPLPYSSVSTRASACFSSQGRSPVAATCLTWWSRSPNAARHGCSRPFREAEIPCPSRPARRRHRDQLYAEAKKRGIEGRSSMNKQELARALGR
ncbi:hypothetical protein EAO69_25570 [Streptomyces sp. me109]|nr:hypothetical protein EAO69_25570 [Streptomyces sp. me109]